MMGVGALNDMINRRHDAKVSASLGCTNMAVLCQNTSKVNARSAMYVKLNIQAHSCKYFFFRGKAVNIAYSECVSVAFQFAIQKYKD
jgi:hypothetical protein